MDALSSEVLVCEGGWRFPLYETRRELGPARLARLLEIQQDIVISERAYEVCRRASAAGPMPNFIEGACQGLLSASQGTSRVSENLFGSDARSANCLDAGPRESGQCEQTREQLTTLRRYQRIGVERAELVASHEVCASDDRTTNRHLRERCLELEGRIRAEAGEAGGLLGRFGLSAPIPEAIAQSVEGVRLATDGHFLNLVPEDSLGVQEQVCERSPGLPTDDPWGRRWEHIRHSLCAEHSVAMQNAETCRNADIYIDERGQMHVRQSLAARSHRRDATLCIDVSDFDGDHPLMMTLGLSPATSVPERVWPGETVSVGHWIDERVRSQDVLQLSIFGKARGVSLKEVLRVNGVDSTGREVGPANAEACRIARSWVPVVDHEFPVGPMTGQAVIPVDFGRGRDGSTAKVEEGDHLVVWVRNIEPSGAVQVEYADGQSVSYEPPPLLGKTDDEPGNVQRIGQHIRGVGASVGEPLLPRRARYHGSRVLRLGSPAGGSEYKIRICIHTRVGQRAQLEQAVGCSTGNAIVNERLYVHGFSRMGVQLHVGYSFFRTPGLTARRTAAAQAAGDDLFEIVEESDGSASQDIAMLLAVYPFGRDPYDFSHRPWTSSYWRHASLLCGFSVKKTSFWEDLYLGGSLPLANGVSTTVLAHFSRREMPTQTSRGQFLRIPGGGDSLNIADYVPTKSTLSVGVGVGISFDLNLFQKAFSGVWARISEPQSQFYSTGRRP
ncbi:MAG: hypothetical protein GY811_07185 [Myxococcales bacterium]|nr:hypothetical protein [Myxococcales bacterium]